MSQAVKTEFAPAGRSEAAEVNRQSKDVQALGQLVQAYETVNDMVAVLNANRQIVYANRNLLALLGKAQAQSLLGLRPGEALGCLHACENNAGCGTSKFCSTCGAVKAILAGLSGRADQQECRVMRDGGAEALDLMVRTTPLTVGRSKFTVCALTDISHQKRRRALERIFFHDVLNNAVGLRYLSKMLADGRQQPGDGQRLYDLVDQLIDQISEQRDLMAAETSELAVRVVDFSAPELVQTLVHLYASLPLCQDRRLAAESVADVTIRSDINLLGRVLGNLIKNALEAAPSGTTVEVAAAPQGEGIEFSVRNEGVMPPEVQLQLFQRSFSTKGAGRGLGTYSIKLLTERYLGGRISMVSNEESGTIFRAWYPSVLQAKAGQRLS